MTNSNSRTWKRSFILAGVMFILMCAAPFCKQESSVDEDADVTPAASIWDTLLGQHSGTCYYHIKYLSTGEEYWDTTFNSIIELSWMDSISSKAIQVHGCGPNPFYAFKLPQNLDTIYSHSELGQGGNDWQIEINPFNKTITTKHSYYYPNPPNTREYTGQWNY